MGSQDKAMMLAGLCLAVLTFSFIEAQTTQSATPSGECCYKKTVTGTANQMDGTYYFKKNVVDVKDPNCADGCLYTREGRESEEYCFKAVTSGAADINNECEAPTGTAEGTGMPSESPSMPPSDLPSGSPTGTPEGTGMPSESASMPPSDLPIGSPTGTPEGTAMPSQSDTPTGTAEGTELPPSASSTPSTAGSTLSPEDTIDAANAAITQASADHTRATENSNTASEASSAVDDIQSSLSTRIKRQSESTTVGPVSDCNDFGSKYNLLLDELSNFSDNNVGLIKQLVAVLKSVVTIPCTQSEKSSLKSTTASKVDSAKSKASSYKAEKEKEKEDAVKRVQAAQAQIVSSNQLLLDAGKQTKAPVTPSFTIPTTVQAETTPAGTGTGITSPQPEGSSGPSSPEGTGTGITSPQPEGSSGPSSPGPNPTGSETNPGTSSPLPSSTPTNITTKKPMSRRLNKLRLFQ